MASEQLSDRASTTDFFGRPVEDGSPNLRAASQAASLSLDHLLRASSARIGSVIASLLRHVERRPEFNVASFKPGRINPSFGKKHWKTPSPPRELFMWQGNFDLHRRVDIKLVVREDLDIGNQRS